MLQALNYSQIPEYGALETVKYDYKKTLFDPLNPSMTSTGPLGISNVPTQHSGI